MASEIAPQITPCDATLGAVVKNVRLNALGDEAFAAIEHAWHAHAVLIFPGQHLTDEEQLAFSRRFGLLERSLSSNHVRANRTVLHLSNMKEAANYLAMIKLATMRIRLRANQSTTKRWTKPKGGRDHSQTLYRDDREGSLH